MMNKHTRLRQWGTCVLLISSLAFASRSMHAQTDTARIQGTVTDTSGAVIPGVTITLTDGDDGVVKTLTTDRSGNFSAAGLVRGNYTVEVKGKGFTSQVQNFSLDVSEARALQFALAVGSDATTVTVTDQAPLVDTTSSSTGEVIKGRQVTELPLNGRNFTSLALLTPGVTRGNPGDQANGSGGNVETFRYNDSGGAALSVNGLRPQANNFILDGADNNESLVNTIVFFTPVDATNEFRVTTSVAQAEFGRAGGAVVQSSIKSGSNSIHGSAFDFLRNSEFDANPNYQFLNSGFQRFPQFIRNQFGGSVGFPILKNKLFLFGDYQGLREKQGIPASFQTVPTTLMRSSGFTDFSELLRPAPSGGFLTSVPGCAIPAGAATPASTGQIYDPINCTPFLNNQIPANRLNPAAVNYLKAFPAPNVPGLVQNNYEAIQSQVQGFNDFDVRLDFNPDAKDQFFARYSYGQDNFTKTSLFPNLPAGFAAGINENHPRGAVAGYTRILSQNVLNEFRIGYDRPQFGYIPPQFGQNVSAQLGIVNANRNALTTGGALIGDNNSQLSYTGDGGTYQVREYTPQVLDSVSWTRGAHSFKFGGNIIQRRVDFFQGNDAKGFFSFNSPNSGSSDQNVTGYDISEALVGFSNYSLGAGSDFFNTKNYETGYFAQDDWKVNRRLTLNLGFRYDLYTFPYTEGDRQSNFDTATGQLLVAGQNGQSKSQVNTNFHNFAPRVGFAYDLFGQGKSVFRGGYGIFYFLDRGGIGNQLSNNPDFNGVSSYSTGLGAGNPAGSRITFTGQGPAGSNDSTLATAALPLPTSTVNIADPANVSVISEPANNKTSVIQQYNLQIQQEVGNSAFTIAYVGTRSNHLVTTFNLNAQPLNTPAGTRIFPTLGNSSSDTVNANIGVSSYDGLQTHFEHRLSQGLTTTASYTWSHTIDDSISPAGGESNEIFIDPATRGPLLNLNKGNSYQDQRNVFSFSTIYDLPFGKGKEFGAHLPKAVDYAAGGWQVNLIAFLNTGTPFDVIDSRNAPTDRADIVHPATISHSVTRPYFDTSAFAAPPSTNSVYTRVGNSGRGILYGPGAKTVNFALQKNVPITERVNAELRGEAFNILNTPQFGNPDANINDNNYGLITGLQNQSERELQLALRLTF